MPSPRLSKLAADYGGDLLLPLNTLATGGSKAYAAFQLVGGVIVTKVLGPLGAVAGIVGGILVQLRNWESTAQLVGRAMEKAAAKDALVQQFAQITKSVAIARAQLQALFTYAQNSPFRFESILEGGKALLQAGGQALATKANLETVGKTAAATGQDFSTMAQAVSALYADLKAGKPVQQSAEALRDYGAISQATVDRIVSLQGANAGVATTFGVATAALNANSVAGSKVVQTLSDLQQKQEQVKAGIFTPAGDVFQQGAKSGTEAQTRLLEKAAPALTQLFQIVARVSQVFGYLQKGILNVIASIPGLSTIISTAAATFTVFSGAVLGVSSIKLASWLLSSATAMLRYTTATGAAAAATEALAVAQGRLSTGRGEIVAAGNMLRRGDLAEGVEGPVMSYAMRARAAAPLAASGAKNVAVGTAGAAGSLAMKAVGEGVTYLRAGVIGLATPLGALVGILAAVAVAAATLANKYLSATESTKAFTEASKETSKQVNKQIDDIKTAGDKASAYAAAMDELKTAQDRFNGVLNQRSTLPSFLGLYVDAFNRIPKQMKDAGDAVTQARANVARALEVPNSSLAVSDEQNEAETQRAVTVEQAKRDSEMRYKTPEERANILSSRALDANTQQDAKTETEQKIALAVTQRTTPEAAAIASTQEAEQKAIQDAETAEQAARDRVASVNKGRNSRNNAPPARAALAQAQANTQAAKDTAARNEALRAGVQTRETGILTGSQSEEMQLRGKLLGTTDQRQRQLIQQQISVAQAKYADPGQKTAAANEQSEANQRAQKLAEIDSGRVSIEEKIAEIRRSTYDQSAEEAKAQIDSLEVQRSLIMENKDLSDKERQNQLGSLSAQEKSIANQLAAQQQLAAERNRQGEKLDEAQKERTEADVASQSGQGTVARGLRASAEKKEGDVTEQQRTRQYTQDYLNEGMTQEEAEAKAKERAKGERTQDLAATGLSNISAITGPVVDSLQRVGGGGGIEQSDPLLNVSQAQLDALTSIKGDIAVIAKNSTGKKTY